MGGVTLPQVDLSRVLADLHDARDNLALHHAGIVMAAGGGTSTQRLAETYLREAVDGLGLHLVDLTDIVALRKFIQDNAALAGLRCYRTEPGH